MMHWFNELLSGLTYSVSLSNPGALVALFAVGILSDIGVPFFFVLETFLFFASYYVGPLSAPVLLIVLMLLLGRECGATVLYWLSAMLGSPLIDWVGKRFPGLSRNLEQSRARLCRRAVMAVAIVRLTPGLLQVPSLVAGVMRLPYLRFLAGVAISSLLVSPQSAVRRQNSHLTRLRSSNISFLYPVAAPAFRIWKRLRSCMGISPTGHKTIIRSRLSISSRRETVASRI